MKKILLVFGTRPEAIKMAPLIKELEKYPSIFDVKVCVTGQHREMLDQVLDIFEIKPDYDLNIMKDGQDLFDITSRILMGMRDVLKDSDPDVVLVHGDTTTSMASALSAFYQQIPVGHIEAGLRTHNIYSPWPEELNRQITGRISTYHFTPTSRSKQNLINEGITENLIHVTGNTVIDALRQVISKIENSDLLSSKVENDIKEKGYNIDRLTNNKKLILITGHRRENFGEGFISICEAIKHLSQDFPEVDFVYPMHLNPNVRKPIKRVFGDDLNFYDNLYFIDPLDYMSFVYLMNKSSIILTDSGGIQEEGPGLGKPVVVMRDTTERPEAVEAGTVKMVGTDSNKIITTISELITNASSYQKMARSINPYGDGNASMRIVKILKENIVR